MGFCFGREGEPNQADEAGEPDDHGRGNRWGFREETEGTKGFYRVWG